jgi:hypothetical protein
VNNRVAKPFEKLLAKADDRALCEGLCDLIVAHHGLGVIPDDLPDEERVVVLAWWVNYLIQNGGFHHLLSDTVPGDADYSRTVEAYERIGCAPATEVFRRVFARFPGGQLPDDVRERVRAYLSGPGSLRWEVDEAFRQAENDIIKCLARFIRDHAPYFWDLRPAKVKRRSEPVDTSPGRTDPVAVGIKELPHCARVAFAARCARLVAVHFRELWPDAIARRREALENAVHAATESAAEGRAAIDWDKLSQEMIMATGAARMISLVGVPMESDEPGPPDGNAALAVASILKAAEFAVKAAASKCEHSAEFATHSYAHAREFAWKTARKLFDRMADDFHSLQRAAKSGRWTDRTPVSPAVFEA